MDGWCACEVCEMHLRRRAEECRSWEGHAQYWKGKYDEEVIYSERMRAALVKLRNASPLCQDAHQFIAIAAEGLGETYKRPAQPGGY